MWACGRAYHGSYAESTVTERVDSVAYTRHPPVSTSSRAEENTPARKGARLTTGAPRMVRTFFAPSTPPAGWGSLSYCTLALERSPDHEIAGIDSLDVGLSSLGCDGNDGSVDHRTSILWVAIRSKLPDSPGVSRKQTQTFGLLRPQ